jgi:hypothetical protein
MHWRYFKAALIGGLLGFAGQCVGDFFCWQMRGGGPTPYRYSVDFQSVHYQQSVMVLFYGRAQQANPLLWQAVFLMWVIDRGEVAVRTAAIAACLGVSTMLGADQLRERRMVQRKAIGAL